MVVKAGLVRVITGKMMLTARVWEFSVSCGPCIFYPAGLSVLSGEYRPYTGVQWGYRSPHWGTVGVGGLTWDRVQVCTLGYSGGRRPSMGQGTGLYTGVQWGYRSSVYWGTVGVHKHKSYINLIRRRSLYRNFKRNIKYVCQRIAGVFTIETAIEN